MTIDVQSLQRFATELLTTCARKTILNVLGTLFGIMEYANKCGMRVPDGLDVTALTITADKGDTEAPYFKPEDAKRIIETAREPYKTIFSLAWSTGLRAGELLGLSVINLDFTRKLILPKQQSDDSTRQLRELKTKKSKSAVAMTPQVESMLTTYLRDHWQKNADALLFPNRTGRPRKREYVVKWGLKPLLRKLGLPTKGVGLHAFRHGLGTALSESKVSPKTVQQILRHSDIKTTFRYYVHSDMDAQRNALEKISIGTNVPIGTRTIG